MTAAPQFQLFPQPPPRGHNPSNPFRRPSRKERQTTRSPSPVPLQELKSVNPESVLIQIIEDTKVIHPLPQAHICQSRSATESPAPVSNRGDATRNRDQPGSPLSHTSQSVDSPSQNNTAHQKAGSSQRSSATSHKSPVVAIRSMFPRYNHELPLNQQDYYPQNAGPGSRPLPASPPNAAQSIPPAEVDAMLGPKTVPASILNFPTDILSSHEVRYSSAEELLNLWETANGQRLHDSLGTFNLRMER
jgi:hypothetical protein